MWSWIIWAVIAFCQNAAFTWVSRARNGGDPTWHRIASWSSNGIWALNLAFGADKMLGYKTNGNWLMFAVAVAFYAFTTTEGAVFAHKILLRHEKGKRRVGA